MPGELIHSKYQVYKPAGVSDPRQVVAQGAAVNVYFQGATSSASPNVGLSAVTVSVFDIGDIRVGDTLERFTSSWPSAVDRITVVSISSQTSFTAQRAGVADVALTVGDRLVPVARSSGHQAPPIYSDEARQTILSTVDGGGFVLTSSVLTDSDGAAAFYTPARVFDVVVSGSGVVTTLVKDEIGGELDTGTVALVKADGNDASAAQNTIEIQAAFERASRAGAPVGEIVLPRGDTRVSGAIQMDSGQIANGGGYGLSGQAGSILKLAASFVGTRLFHIGNDFRHDTLRFKGVTFDGSLISSVTLFEMLRGARELIYEGCTFLNWNGTILNLGRAGGSELGDAVTRLVFEKNIVRNLTGASSAVIKAQSVASLIANGNILDDLVGRFLVVAPASSVDYARQIECCGNVAHASSGWNSSFVDINGAASSAADRDGEQQSYSIDISENHIDGCRASEVIAIDSAHKLSIRSNILSSCGGSTNALIALNAVRNAKVFGNTLDGGGSTNASGLSVNTSQVVDAWENTIFDLAENGVELIFCAIVTVGANIIEHVNKENSTTQGGIVASSCDTLGIGSLNVCKDCSATAGYGVIIGAGSTNCFLGGNLLRGNGTGAYNDQGTGTVIAPNME